MFKRTQKPTTPRTKTQKARFWATVTLVLCGSYSIWANVSSGRANHDSVVVSVLPPIVAFCLSHLIGYLNPKTRFQKILVWAGFGLSLLFAFIASGYHIWEKSYETGQPWYIALTYPFLSDIPMIFAAVALVQKVPATQTQTRQTEPVTVPAQSQAKPRSSRVPTQVPAGPAKPPATRVRASRAKPANPTASTVQA